MGPTRHRVSGYFGFMPTTFLLAFLILVHGNARAGIIRTYAGGLSGAMPAVSTNLSSPTGVAIDGAGNIYVSDWLNYRVRKIDRSTGMISTVAGTGTWSLTRDGGPAVQAGLNGPYDVAVDGSGNVFIADYGNHLIRRVDAVTGIITSVAGNGSFSFSGDGGPATQAGLYNPSGVALDTAGNIYIADSSNLRVRKVDAATGLITTVAGGGNPPDGLGDGGPAIQADIAGPMDIALDGSGNIFIADDYHHRIRRVDAVTGIITTVAGTGGWGFSGDGGPAIQANLYNPRGVSLDAAGNIYISEFYNDRIRKVDASTGIITTIAGNGGEGFSGDGGPAIQARLYHPRGGVAIDGSGNIYIPDCENMRIRKVEAATGVITTLAGNGTEGYSGDGLSAPQASLRPAQIRLDPYGNVYIADASNSRVRRVDAMTGIITTVAGGGSPPDGLGDGGPATQAALGVPVDVALDAQGNLFIADTTLRVRRVDAATGVISTAAGNGTWGASGDGGPATQASLWRPSGLALDLAGNLFISEYDRYTVRRVDALTGIIETVAGGGNPPDGVGDGGPATQALIQKPIGIAVDDSGNLFIAEMLGSRIRKVDFNGMISTVAGNGTTSLSGDGGPAIQAGLHWPNDVALDNEGNLYIADAYNSRIRKVDVNGIISTVAGSGAWGDFNGDGGPALGAAFQPGGVETDANGGIFITDGLSNRIREVYRVRASFAASPDRGFRNQAFSFNNVSKAPETATYLWNFGDGTSSAETGPTHAYAVKGVYTVSLTASVPGGGPDDTSTLTRTDYLCAGYIFSAGPQTATTAPFSRSYALGNRLYNRVWALPSDVNPARLKAASITVRDSRGHSVSAALIHEGGGIFSGNVLLDNRRLAAGSGTASFSLQDKDGRIFSATEQIMLQ